MRTLDTRWLGRIPYEEGLRLQDDRVLAIREEREPEALYLLEHAPVLTLGRNAHRENIVASDARLAELGIEVHDCGRGGDVTYHGPGQLVGYPIVNLAPDRKDVWKYVRGLEEAIILTLGDFGASAGRIPGLTGVWVGDEKVAAIGVRISRWITSHGFALNVATDLSHFETIIPCGIRDHGVTSLERLLGTPPDIETVAHTFAGHFARHFDREIAWEILLMPRVKTPEPKRPDWIKVKLHNTDEYREVKALVKGLSLNTVCEEARCPNIFECWGREKTATFMIMGDICTRRCMFCSVDKGQPGYLDPGEPRHVAEAVAKLGLRHAVITQVNRDDLPDEGATHFAETIRLIRELNPECRVEVLISDLDGNWDALDIILDAGPDVLAHNTECVPRLYKRVRPMAVYERTMELLARAAKARGTRIGATKSGIMAGLGETREEIVELMQDLRRSDVDIFTVGQYLKPTKRHLPVQKYYTPEEFLGIHQDAMTAGFVYAESGAMVRSSYHANRASDAMERLLAESPFQKARAARDTAMESPRG